MRKNHEWTAEEDKLIRKMLEAGASVVEICDRIGVDYGDMKNHLHALRKADPTFPRCMTRGHPGVINEAFDRAFEEDGRREEQAPPLPEEPKGELNALEAAMAEQIKELTREVECLTKENAEQEKENLLQEEDLKAYETQVRDLTEEVERFAKRNAELEKNYVAKFEKQDGYIHELEERVYELEDIEAAQAERNSELEKIVHTQVDCIEKMAEEKRMLEAKLAKANGIVVDLVGRYVL